MTKISLPGLTENLKPLSVTWNFVPIRKRRRLALSATASTAAAIDVRSYPARRSNAAMPSPAFNFSWVSAPALMLVWKRIISPTVAVDSGKTSERAGFGVGKVIDTGVMGYANTGSGLLFGKATASWKTGCIGAKATCIGLEDSALARNSAGMKSELEAIKPVAKIIIFCHLPALKIACFTIFKYHFAV